MAVDSNTFPVVGIGASAGGLQAIKQLFDRMPVDTGMAFVIVTHLPLGRESDLPEIVSRYTKIRTSVAGANQVIEPDHVYVCPPDHILTIEEGCVRLKAREDPVQRKPIDVFLSSLANDRGEAAVGILLSGSGSDGALGMKAIKERGGLTLAQGTDGAGPQHSEMPDAAIASGVVDLVMPAEEMAARLTEFAGTFALADDDVADIDTAAAGEYQRSICQIILQQVGHDFSGYKQRTFQRRVRRRMQVLQIRDAAGYLNRLREDSEEVTNLFRDLLIGVTNFFRDPEAFDALERWVIPQLFAGKGANDLVRVWVPGCATGEEVYSIAILMRERMATSKAQSIFAGTWRPW
jgi:two-component system CheB/CheR fusion protein